MAWWHTTTVYSSNEAVVDAVFLSLSSYIFAIYVR